MFVADRHSHLIFNTGRQITIMTAETSTVQKVIELEDNGRKGVMTSDGGLYCVTQGNGICAFRASGFTTKELDPTEHSVRRQVLKLVKSRKQSNNIGCTYNFH